MSRFGIQLPKDRIPSLLELSAEPGSVNEILFGLGRQRWGMYVALAPFGIASILVGRASLLYLVALVVAVVVLATVAANLTPGLYDWVNVGPRALLVSDKRLELVRLPKPDQPPVSMATYDRDSVDIEPTGNWPPPGTRIRIHDKDGRLLATLRNCRPYGRDGSRLGRAASASAATRHIA